ncbi:hypothetical protein [Anaerocellum diazotrophicum]|uniref:Glycosyl transferase family 8 n=1 Tax=Caldicellulosiruptor diazotrophicus TaxID=2806205 RepID=A0ABN6E4V8_9FIRM|nr:hypothetical protein [Caldicellulosiruptor diazotrophicus]BCS80371.1 hypothetical protein CaldiYA01_03310 [Caldicellulosiruptor diazotrophicus]
MTTYLCTWLYLEEKGKESYYPQVDLKSSSYIFQKIYWKCVAVFFYSAVLFNKERNDVKYLFFTNINKELIPNNLDGFDLKKFLEKEEIEVVTLPLTYEVPQDYFSAWRNQFYIFDVFKYVTTNEKYCMDDNFIILDCDCIINNDLGEMLKKREQHKILLYCLEYDISQVVNGLSRQQMKEVYEDILNIKLDCVPRYYGGEIVAAKKEVIVEVYKEFTNLFPIMLERNKQKKLKFNEEAQTLSFLYYKLGFENNEANKFIKRIWTSPKCYNFTEGDMYLHILHLPYE